MESILPAVRVASPALEVASCDFAPARDHPGWFEFYPTGALLQAYNTFIAGEASEPGIRSEKFASFVRGSMIAEGRYSHSGTYNANTIACAAVSATMDVLAEPGLYERQRALGERLMGGLRKLATEAGLPVIVEGLGTVFQLWFSERPIRNWRDAQRYADEELFTRWWQEMLLRGVLFHPSQYENLFLSLVHTDADVDEMLTAAEEAFAVIARGRLG